MKKIISMFLILSLISGCDKFITSKPQTQLQSQPLQPPQYVNVYVPQKPENHTVLGKYLGKYQTTYDMVINASKELMPAIVIFSVVIVPCIYVPYKVYRWFRPLQPQPIAQPVDLSNIEADLSSIKLQNINAVADIKKSISDATTSINQTLFTNTNRIAIVGQAVVIADVHFQNQGRKIENAIRGIPFAIKNQAQYRQEVRQDLERPLKLNFPNPDNPFRIPTGVNANPADVVSGVEKPSIPPLRKIRGGLLLNDTNSEEEGMPIIAKRSRSVELKSQRGTLLIED
jgi:hypothetical protein